MNSFPTRDAVVLRLEGLCSGTASREDVASWAMAIVNDDTVKISDYAVWWALKKLGIADFLALEHEYLYSEVDFEEWKLELL